MRILLIIFAVSILLTSCGKKSRPEYKSAKTNNITVYLK